MLENFLFDLMDQVETDLTTEIAIRQRDLRLLSGERNILVQMSVPGLRADDLSISAQDGILLIKGERKETLPEGYKLTLGRVPTYKVEQRVRLSDQIDVDSISATLSDGILTVTLPRLQKAGPKTVKVKVS